MLFDVRLAAGAPVAVTCDAPEALNYGASSGPRILSAGFEVRFHPRRREDTRRAILVAELDGRRFQDASAARRRAARAVVSVAKRAAEAIRTDRIEPTFELRSRNDRAGPGQPVRTWVAALAWMEEPEGFPRRVQASLELAGRSAAPQLDRGAALDLARLVQLGAEHLHAAVDAPANRPVFGAG